MPRARAVQRHRPRRRPRRRRLRRRLRRLRPASHADVGVHAAAAGGHKQVVEVASVSSLQTAEYGYLGQGNRVIIPHCVITAIRSRYRAAACDCAVEALSSCSIHGYTGHRERGS